MRGRRAVCVLDASGCVVLPGLVDARAPSQTPSALRRPAAAAWLRERIWLLGRRTTRSACAPRRLGLLEICSAERPPSSMGTVRHQDRCSWPCARALRLVRQGDDDRGDGVSARCAKGRARRWTRPRRWRGVGTARPARLRGRAALPAVGDPRALEGARSRAAARAVYTHASEHLTSAARSGRETGKANVAALRTRSLTGRAASSPTASTSRPRSARCWRARAAVAHCRRINLKLGSGLRTFVVARGGVPSGSADGASCNNPLDA